MGHGAAAGPPGSVPPPPGFDAATQRDPNGQVHEREQTITSPRIPGGKHARPRSPAQRALIEWGVVLVGAVIVVVVVRTFFVQAFYIPSASMQPTLRKNDRVLVNKLSYTLHSVHRGDVVVFDRPSCDAANTPVWASCEATGQIKDLIKRVVGLPGDTITVQDDHVLVDGKRLSEPYTHGLPTRLICSFPGTYRVPKGDVFVMGDNRTNSTDSRCFGPISEKIIVGRAFVRVWPLSRIGFL